VIYLGSIFLFPLEIVFRSTFYARGSQAIGCHLRHRFELLNMEHTKLPTSSQFELSFIFTYVPLAVAFLNVGLWDETIRLLSTGVNNKYAWTLNRLELSCISMSTARVPGHLSLIAQLDMVTPLCDAGTSGLCVDPQSATARGSSCSVDRSTWVDSNLPSRLRIRNIFLSQYAPISLDQSLARAFGLIACQKIHRNRSAPRTPGHARLAKLWVSGGDESARRPFGEDDVHTISQMADLSGFQGVLLQPCLFPLYRTTYNSWYHANKPKAWYQGVSLVSKLALGLP